METGREFLESSTIHGLFHISTSKSILAKLCWSLIVMAGFCTAGYLIHNSYSEWYQSPIASTISTQPIEDLEFPKVIVCPPEGSNTALNYDLMKEESLMTEQKRKELQEAVRDIFLIQPHLNFTETVIAQTNEDNIRHVEL